MRDFSCPRKRPSAGWVSIPANVYRVGNVGIEPVYCLNSGYSMSTWTVDIGILQCRSKHVGIPYVRVLDPGILCPCPLWCWRIEWLVMARCHGQLPISTKVDQAMLDYIDESAEEAGVSRSEFIRRMLDGYRLADEAGECPDCGTNLEFDHE